MRKIDAATRKWLAENYAATEIDAVRYYDEMALVSSRVVEHENSYSNGVQVETSVLADGRTFIRHAGLWETLYFEMAAV